MFQIFSVDSGSFAAKTLIKDDAPAEKIDHAFGQRARVGFGLPHAGIACSRLKPRSCRTLSDRATFFRVLGVAEPGQSAGVTAATSSAVTACSEDLRSCVAIGQHFQVLRFGGEQLAFNRHHAGQGLATSISSGPITSRWSARALVISAVRGVHQLALADPMQDGLQGHALEISTSQTHMVGRVDDALLLDDVRSGGR
jgi:hypothetical protein